MTVFVQEDVPPRVLLCRELLIEHARKFPCSRESHVTFRKPNGILEPRCAVHSKELERDALRAGWERA